MWILLALGLGLVALRSWAPCRDTTLQFAWGWFWVSLASVIAAYINSDSLSSAGPSRYIAVCGLSSPFMAVLGAKRPQHRAWQFVVATLWIVLSLPGWESWAYGAAQVRPDSLRVAVLTGLLALGWINWWGTRFWLAATLTTAGHTLMLSPFLPGVRESQLASWPQMVGPLLVGCGAGWGCFRARAMTWPTGRGTLEACSLRWRNWRDLFGVVWAFRVLERMHATIAAERWPVTANWSGFHPAPRPDRSPSAPSDRAVEEQTAAQIELALQGMLRRFLAERHFHQPTQT